MSELHWTKVHDGRTCGSMNAELRRVEEGFREAKEALEVIAGVRPVTDDIAKHHAGATSYAREVLTRLQAKRLA